MAANWVHASSPGCLTVVILRRPCSGGASRGSRATITVIAAVLLASCDGDSRAVGDSSVPTTSNTGAATVIDDSAPVVSLITSPPSDAGLAALITGPLTLVDGCFYVDATEGGSGVAVFEQGTTFDPATRSIVNPDGSAVPVGSAIEASGGGIPIDVSSDPAVAECAERAGTDLFVVLGAPIAVATS